MLSHAMATPRVFRPRAVVAVLALALPLLPRPATPAQEVPATRSVDGVVISVGSLERAIDFYTKVLTFELVSQSEVVDEGARSRIARLRLGREAIDHRSEEHTSELQSRLHLVCRLLLEKKKIDRALVCVEL